LTISQEGSTASTPPSGYSFAMEYLLHAQSVPETVSSLAWK
jgi:hypothetical protein